MDCIVHAVAKSRTRLSNFHFHFLSYIKETGLEKLKIIIRMLLKQYYEEFKALNT